MGGSHHPEVSQTQPNRAAPQISTSPHWSKPLDSSNCHEPHSQPPNLQPPRNPTTHTQKDFDESSLQPGGSKCSSLCPESQGNLGHQALSSLLTLPFVGSWVVSLISLGLQ